MSVILSPLAGAGGQFLNNSGIILSGGKLYTYAAGTTVLQTSYTSSDGLTAHTNPIILDSSGRVPGGEIWFTSTLAYKIVVKDSTNVTIATYDNLTGADAAFVPMTGFEGQSGVVQDLAGDSGAAWIGFQPDGGDARSVQSKLRDTVNVKDFGAKGDGLTDDYIAITSALTYLTSIGGGTLYFPQAKYACSGQIVWSNAPITLQGESTGLQPNTGTQIIFTVANTGGVNFKNGSNGKGHFSGVRDLWLKGSDTALNAGWATGSGAGILAQSAFSTIENVHVSGFGGVGVYYLSGISSPDVAINTNNCVAIKVRSSGNYANGWMTKGVDSNACTFIKVDASSNGAWGIVEGSNIGNTYLSPHLDGNTTGAVNLPSYGGGGVQMYGVYKETDAKPGIQIDAGNAGNHFIVCSTMDDSVVDNTTGKTSTIIWPPGGLHSNKYAIGNGARNSWTITDLLMLCQYGFVQHFYNADNSALWSIQCLTTGDNRLQIQSAQGADFLLGNRLAAPQLAATSAATAPTGGSGVVIGGTIAATATAGGAGGLPAQAAGYIVANINGTQVKIPYFAA